MRGETVRRVFLLLAAFICLVSAVSCRMDFSIIGGNDTVYANSCRWLGCLDPDTLVKNITIPGTHDSCARTDFLGFPSTSSTQDLSLEEQLDAGVRCLDIRIQEKDGGWGIFHGPVYMDMMLDDVVEVCRRFLEKNPTEFIIIFGQYENGHHRLATQAIAALRESDTDLFYQGDGHAFREAKISDLAGKIVPALSYIRIYGEPDLVSELDFWVPDDEEIDEEDYWETEDPREILAYAKDMIGRYGNRDVHYPELPGKISVSSHFRGQFGLPNYRIVSSCVNPGLQSWFSERRGSGNGYGIIMTDHVSRDLSYAIYNTNVLISD